MIDKNIEENYFPEQRICAHTTLRFYSQLGLYLSKEDAAAVVEAHQVLFPHSSPHLTTSSITHQYLMSTVDFPPFNENLIFLDHLTNQMFY